MNDATLTQIQDGLRAARELCRVADRMRELMETIEISTRLVGGAVEQPEIHRSLRSKNERCRICLQFWREQSLLSFGFDVQKHLEEVWKMEVS